MRRTLSCICLLLEVDWLIELWHVVDDFAGVFDECNATIFVAADEIEIAVFVPIEGGGDNHLQVHENWFTITRRDVDQLGENVGFSRVPVFSNQVKPSRNSPQMRSRSPSASKVSPG